MRGPPRATWTNATIAGILALHACPARCGARRRCGTAKSASAPCLPLSAGTLLRHSSPRQAAHAPQRLIAPDDTSSPIQQSRTCLSASASRRPLSPHQFRHSAPDIRGSVQPSTLREGDSDERYKIGAQHRTRKALLDIRQSSAHQVQYTTARAKSSSTPCVTALCSSAGRISKSSMRTLAVLHAGGTTRAGFERMVAEVCLGKVGAVAAREVSRFARNSRDWQQLVEMCRVVDTLLVDQEAGSMRRDKAMIGCCWA